MTIHIYYRTHRGSNDKPRPSWFCRSACLSSLRAACDQLPEPVAFTFVADGGLPEELENEVRSADEVLTFSGGTAAASLRTTIKAAVSEARRHPDDFFWICEDDYLYRPDSMRRLTAAIDAIPDVEYFSLFGPKPSDWADNHPSQPIRSIPEIEGGPRRIDGITWQRHPGTTSTFGVRGRALVRDARLIIRGTRPGAPFDGATWYLLQGVRPYSWRHLFHDIGAYLSPRGLAKIVGKPVMRVAINLSVLLTRGSPRALVVPDTNLSVHVEINEIDPDSDWEEVSAAAASTRAPR